MKLIMSREEIKEIVGKFYNIQGDFQLEISKEQSECKQPEPQMKIKTDSNGFVTDIIPLNEDGSLVVPHKNHKGQSMKFENTCKICGRTFYTNNAKADICSKECLDKASQECLAEINKKPKKSRVKIKREKTEVSATESAKKKQAKKKSTGCTSKKFDIKNPRNDYMPLGLEIEEFLASDDTSKIIYPDGMTPQGVYYRYVVASKMFGYRDKLKISTLRDNTVRLTKKEACV